MTENEVKLDLSFIRNYKTQEEFCFEFADDLFEQWPALAEVGVDSHDVLKYALTNARSNIPTREMTQANGTKKEAPLYQITISMLKDIQKDLEKGLRNGKMNITTLGVNLTPRKLLMKTLRRYCMNLLSNYLKMKKKCLGIGYGKLSIN